MPHTDLTERQRYNQRYYEKHRKTIRQKRDTGENVRADEKKALFACRLPVSVIARMQRIADEGMAKGNYPWKTRTAVCQAMIIRGMETLANDPMIAEMLQYLRVTSAIDDIAAHRREANAAFANFRTEISELLAIKATAAALQYFHTTIAAWEAMSPNVWRDHILDKMRNAFPRLANQAPPPTTLHHADREVVTVTVPSTGTGTRGRRR